MLLDTEKTKKLRVEVKKGFTLLEILVVVSLLGLVAVITSSLLLVSLRASAKAEVIKEVRQNGNHALSVMEGIILNSQKVGCTSPSIVNAVDLEGKLTTFKCDANKIASNSAVSGNSDLTSNSVIVSDCNFTCDEKIGVPVRVNLVFKVKKQDSLDPNKNVELQFETTVVPRNVD